MIEVDQALYARLTGDNSGAGNLMAQLPGGFHQIIPPANQETYPLGTYQNISTPRVYSLKRLAYADAKYLIKLYDSLRSWKRIKAAMERVNFLLNDHALAVEGYDTLYLRQTNGFDTSQTDERTGKIYAVTIAYFKIEVSPQ